MKPVLARVEAVLMADHGVKSFETRRLAEAELDFGGIRGDRHFGMTAKADVRQPEYPRGTEIFNRRQLTIVSAEECAAIAEALGIPQVKPEWLGANLLLSGLPDLTALPLGSRMIFESGAGLNGQGENFPCREPGELVQANHPDHPKVASRFVKAAYRKRGIVCFVERSGIVRPGDAVRIWVNDGTLQ
ncbi:MOSC domain-containing protein [Paenibacillus sp. MWE-103]|uniref:MOSC domain-containing protein n=1 Tax=Paenibacillus artemisiicola TaxID=1172618 RepID=A0ABS3WK05_9BACL|nr:MOSC domain-containing protein [Paenibacillus artemisiicola]MBO7748668.1 MOSC domain-containing protein [Paenibacillus artemisiicola]